MRSDAYTNRVIRSVKGDRHKQLLRDSTGTRICVGASFVAFTASLHLSVLGTNAQHLNLWCWCSLRRCCDLPPFAFPPSIHSTQFTEMLVPSATWPCLRTMQPGEKDLAVCVALYPLAIKLELSTMTAFSRFSQCCFVKKSSIHL